MKKYFETFLPFNISSLQTNEKEQDYYHQKWNLIVTAGVAGRLTTHNFSNLENLRKISKCSAYID